MPGSLLQTLKCYCDQMMKDTLCMGTAESGSVEVTCEKLQDT